MATVDGNRVDRDDGAVVLTWEGLTENDEGNGLGVGDVGQLTVQASGDFDASGAVTMEGSNDGTNWGTLHDITGTDVVLADSEPVCIMEQPLYVRPNPSAGSAVEMDVIAVGKRVR